MEERPLRKPSGIRASVAFHSVPLCQIHSLPLPPGILTSYHRYVRSPMPHYRSGTVLPQIHYGQIYRGGVIRATTHLRMR